MAALLLDDVPQYSDFAERSGSYHDEPMEDPLEKLMYLADNKYWNEPDHLDMIITKILSRTREIDDRLKKSHRKTNSNIFGTQPDVGLGYAAEISRPRSARPNTETFLLPKVVAYMAFTEKKMKEDESCLKKEGDVIYNAIREVLNEEFCSPFYFAEAPPYEHLYPEQDKISNAYWDDVRCIGPIRHRGANFYYNNPFDPRIQFDGCRPWCKGQSNQKSAGRSRNENLFLAASDISGMLEQHTLQYRLFLHSLQSQPAPNPQHQQPATKGQGHDLDMSRLENLPLRYDGNDKELEKIVEPLLRDEVKFLWMFDPLEQNIHLEQGIRQGPGPIGPPTKPLWAAKPGYQAFDSGPYVVEAEINPGSGQSPRTMDTGSQLTDTADNNNAMWTDWGESRSRWENTYNWITNTDAPLWKSASDPDVYRSRSQSAKIRPDSSSSHERRKPNEQGSTMMDAHPIPSRVTSDQRLPSQRKARLPPVRTELTKQEDTQSKTMAQSVREDRKRFWRESFKAFPNTSPQKTHDSKDSESTNSGQSGSAPPVKIHGHYTPADHFKYMVHQLAAQAQVKQGDEEEELLTPARGGYRGRPSGRPFYRGGQYPRGRGVVNRWTGNNMTSSDGNAFRWKRGVRNKFKWYSANYRDWNNEEQMIGQRDADDDVEMVSVENERGSKDAEGGLKGEGVMQEKGTAELMSDRRADGQDLAKDGLGLEKRTSVGDVPERQQQAGDKNVNGKTRMVNSANGKASGGISDPGALSNPGHCNGNPAGANHKEDLGEIYVYKNGKYLPKSTSHTPIPTKTCMFQNLYSEAKMSTATTPYAWRMQTSTQGNKIPQATNRPRIPWNVSVPPANRLGSPNGHPPSRPPAGLNTPRHAHTPPPQQRPNPWHRGPPPPPPPGFHNVYRLYSTQHQRGNLSTRRQGPRFTARMTNASNKPFQPRP